MLYTQRACGYYKTLYLNYTRSRLSFEAQYTEVNIAGLIPFKRVTQPDLSCCGDGS